MARAMWKGTLRIGKEALPVKLYAAVEESSVRFHLLHDRDRVRLRQHMVNPRTGAIVPPQRIKKGFPSDSEPGSFVLLEAQELEKLAPKPSRDITIHRFVPRSAIGPGWFDRPYYLGPDGEAAAYAALAAAVERKGELGIARWVMRKKEYAGALHARDGLLMLMTLRAAGEVIEASELEAPSGPALAARERQLARQLLATLEGPFDPEAYHDRHRELVLELIAAKARGSKVKLKRFRPKAAPATLAAALAKSLQAAKGRAGRRERRSA